MMMTESNNQTGDILSRLDAMLVQEATVHCFNYLKHSPNSNVINESSRSAMVTWITQVQTTLNLHPTTVHTAMSYFDRYLSSGRGNAAKVLGDRCLFQLAAITCFYTAVKIYEPVVLGLDMLTQICRGTYTEADITSMESDILSALQWRVSTHNPMDFVRTLLELVPQDRLSAEQVEDLTDASSKHVDYAISNLDLACCKSSVLGISALATALSECSTLNLEQMQCVWIDLSETVEFELSTPDAMVVQTCLIGQACLKTSTSSSGTVSRKGMTRTSSYSFDDVGSVSPVCVSQTARQALEL